MFRFVPSKAMPWTFQPFRHSRKSGGAADRSVRPRLESLEDRALLNAGTLDPTFGAGGHVVTGIPNTTGITGLVLQPDGKLVAGSSSGNSVILERYNSNGTPDASFGSAGLVTANLGIDGPVSLVLETDGKIVVAGTSGTLTSNNLMMAVSRFLPNGALDSSFGTGGVANVGPGVEGRKVALQADGKILVAGITLSQGTTIQAIVVARLNIDGTVDTGFGSNGRAQAFISGDAVPIPVGIGVQPNGRIITATGVGNVVLVGFDVNGALDAGFGSGGISTSGVATPGGLSLLADGRIVVAGSAPGGAGHSDFAVARYFANGVLDASFGAGGVALTDFGQNAHASAVAVQPDGRYVAAGDGLNSFSAASFALARYNPNGGLDTTFGTGGIVLTPDPGLNPRASQLVVQSDGRAVAADGEAGLLHLVRYVGDTPLPTANQRLVAQIYLDLLSRPVDGNGLAEWVGLLDQGINRSQVVGAIEVSQEFLTHAVNLLYAQYLHRTADPTGMNASINFFRFGGTMEQLIAVLVSSPEFRQSQGQGTNDGFLNALYQDALNRALDPSGRAAWDQALANGASYAQVADAILSSTEYRQDVVEEAYGLFLRRKADPSGLDNFTAVLNQGIRDESISALIIGSSEYFQRVAV